MFANSVERDAWSQGKGILGDGKMEAILLLRRSLKPLSYSMAYPVMSSRVKMCTSKFLCPGHFVIMAESVHGSSARARAVVDE
jgi:hypothetical protein